MTSRALTPRSVVLWLSCCALAWGQPAVAPGAASAWTDAQHRLVLDAPPVLDWKAFWIDPGPEITVESAGRVFQLRKKFNVADVAAFQRVRVSADSRYKLFVNGTPAARGPARSDPEHQLYDTLDLSTLVHPGENVIAAEVIYWGQGEPSRGGPIFQMSVRPAFLLEAGELKTDRTWKVRVAAGRGAPGGSGRRATS